MIIDSQSTLEQAMIAIDQAGTRIVFVTRDTKLVGSCSDGDARRFLLRGGKMSDSVGEVMNVNPSFINVDGNLINTRPQIKNKYLPIIGNHGEIESIVREKDYFLPMAVPEIGQKELSSVADVVRSTWISSSGNDLRTFEDNFSNYSGNAYGVAVSNGSAALVVALMAIGVGQGDEVVLPSLTFGAVANAILLAGAIPVYVDTEKERPILKITQVKEVITEKTKAIIAVHSYGHVCDIAALKNIIPKDVVIIEDCAEAHSASLKDKRVGALGDISCYSFFANKIITTGEGGMCCTNNPYLADQMRIIRDHGMDPNNRYWHLRVGMNFRMTNIQGAIGNVQLKNIETNIARRNECKLFWKQFLTGKKVKYQEIKKLPYETSAPWFHNIYFNDLAEKNNLKALLRKRAIDCRDFFYILPNMKALNPVPSERTFPNSTRFSELGLSLPTYSDEFSLSKLQERLSY